MQVKINMKKSLLLLLIVLQTIVVSAQELTVKSFNLAENDISAQTQPRKDLNDKNCALVKVGLGLQGAKFEGSIVGTVENRIGEYWVYMPRGVRMLQIKHPSCSPTMLYFSEYGIEKLEGNRTYYLVLNYTTSQEDDIRKLQRLTIHYKPEDALLTLNGTLMQCDKGVFSAMLPFGTYEYEVRLLNTKKSGRIQLSQFSPTEISIDLLGKKNVVDYIQNQEERVVYNTALKCVINNQDQEAEKIAKKGIHKGYKFCYEILEILLLRGYYDDNIDVKMHMEKEIRMNVPYRYKFVSPTFGLG